MAGIDAGTHTYEAAEGSAMEGPTFDVPRSYTFKPGKSLLLSTFGSDRPNGLYCEVLFVEQEAYVVVTYEGKNFVVPQGNKPVEVGPNLLVKYDHPRVKLIPNLTRGVFRTGMFLDISSVQNTAAKQAIKDSQGPTHTVEIDDPEGEEEVKVLPKNPTLIAEQPEVLETYRDKGEQWVAPENFEDEFLILEGDQVLFTGKIQRRADGGRELLRENKEPLALATELVRIPVRDGREVVKAMIFIENGTLKVHPLAENALQIGSRDQIYRDRLAGVDSKEPVSVSNTSTIYQKGVGFRTPIRLQDPERVIRMIPMGNWEAGASVVALVRDGVVTVQNRSTSTRTVGVARVMPNGPAISIKDHAHIQLFDQQGALTLAVIALSSEAPMRISDSLARPRADIDLKSLVFGGREGPRVPGGLRETIVPRTAPASASNQLRVVPSLPPDEETTPSPTRSRIALAVGAAIGFAAAAGTGGMILKSCVDDATQAEVSGMAVPDED